MATSPSSRDNQAEAFASSGGGSGHDDALQLPPPDPESDLPKIGLGETIRLEEMGPIILNTDGTTRRIENWDTMTEKEKQVTWRRISKRNEERRQKLLEQQKELIEQREEKDADKTEEL